MKSRRITESTLNFGFYFLPEMTTGSGSWAISHFKPTLELEIIGTSRASTEEMKSKEVTGEIIASWIDNDAIAPNIKYLVEESGKLLTEIRLRKD